jgi:hypothetical protein
MNIESSSAALFSLVGIAFGGGLTIVRDQVQRLRERRALRSGLHGALTALLDVVEARGVRRHLDNCARELEGVIERGDGHRKVYFPQIPANNDYFAAFDKLIPSIGLLNKKEAYRFLRFINLAKSSTEMLIYRPGISFAIAPAKDMIETIRSEARVMDLAIEAGRAILERRPEGPPLFSAGSRTRRAFFADISPPVEPPIAGLPDKRED